jgi:signal transduction histidine kinase
VKLSLTTRIFLGFAVVLVTFVGVSLFSVSELHRSQVEIRLVSEGYLSLSQTVAALETYLAYQSKDMERLRDEENAETRRALIRLQRPYFPSLITERLEAGRATAHRVRELAPESEQRFVEDVTRKLDELSARFADYESGAGQLFTMLESEAPDWNQASDELRRLQQVERASSSAIRLLHGSIEARIHERVRQAEERSRRTEVAIILLPVVAIGVGLLATGIAARSLRPVRMLSEGLGRIRQGDFNTRLGIPGDDEIAQLAAQFDAMVGALKDRDALLRQKQAELLRAERLAAVGRVSAQVAHEVRNPLSSIGLNVELLQDRLAQATFATPEAATETRELLVAVTREIDRVTEITEDYLRLARLPAPVLREENLVELLEEVLGFSSSELQRAGVTLSTTFPPAALLVRVDEAQLRQVFLNLVRNAREAMPAGGQLTVTAWNAAAGVEVRVQDTGTGISAEVQDRIYEPFFTTKAGGTGLGLSLSRQIVEAHGGRIELESVVDRGTTFHVYFPP